MQEHTIYHPKAFVPRVLKSPGLLVESSSDVRRRMTATISLFVGTLLVIKGIYGLFAPTAMGLHLSAIHSAIILSAGALLTYNWYTTNSRASFITCLSYGLFFGLLSAAGFLLGDPTLLQTEPVMYDQYVLRIIPGFQALTSVDHTFHAILSVILLLGAFDWHNTHIRHEEDFYKDQV